MESYPRSHARPLLTLEHVTLVASFLAGVQSLATSIYRFDLSQNQKDDAPDSLVVGVIVIKFIAIGNMNGFGGCCGCTMTYTTRIPMTPKARRIVTPHIIDMMNFRAGDGSSDPGRNEIDRGDGLFFGGGTVPF